jgi:hypothetical protein
MVKLLGGQNGLALRHGVLLTRVAKPANRGQCFMLGVALAPKRFSQLGLALGVADAGISQQARVELRQLPPAAAALLPQFEAGQQAHK